MPSIAAVSSTNQGVDTSHPNYSVNVSIPAPAAGAPDDYILVVVGYRAPRSTNGYALPGAPVVAFLGDGGLAGLTWGAPSDGATPNHGYGHAIFYGPRSTFTGGTITTTATSTTASPGELHVSITTIVIDGAPGAPVDITSTGSSLSGAATIVAYNDVSYTGDFNVAILNDMFYHSTAVTLSPAGSFSMHTSRVLSGVSAVPHRVGIATATDPTTNGRFDTFEGVVTRFAFRAPVAPPATRRRRGFGLIR